MWERGTCGIWGHREEAQKSLHETTRLAEARLVRHTPENCAEASPHKIWHNLCTFVLKPPHMLCTDFQTGLLPAQSSHIIWMKKHFRITKAKAKAMFGLKYLCGHECERSSAAINLSQYESESDKVFRGSHFTVMSVSTVALSHPNIICDTPN